MTLPRLTRQLGLAIAGAVTLSAIMPSGAQAMWVRDGWRPVRWVAPPVHRRAYRPVWVAAPAYVAPAPVPLVRPARWVPGHYTRFGGWVSGHWR